MRCTILMLLGVLLLSCGDQDQNASTDEKSSPENVITDGVITAEEFKKGLTDLAEVQLIDVRTPEEFEEGHLSGARNLNYFDDNFDEQIVQLDQNKPIYLYCKSGGRSGKTYKKLKDLGFFEVYDRKGGYSEWPDK